MTPQRKAILRNEKGEHLNTLSGDEIEVFEYLASIERVFRFEVMRKGRMTVVFRLKAEPEPANPSNSPETKCSLSAHDSCAMAGCFGRIGRHQIERWLGWGLIPAGTVAFSA